MSSVTAELGAVQTAPITDIVCSFGTSVDTKRVTTKRFTLNPGTGQSAMEQFCEWINTFDPAAKKESSPITVGASFLQGRRLSAEIDSVTMLQLDYDAPGTTTLAAVIEAFEQGMNVCAAGMETHSSTAALPRFAVFVPLVAPCTLAQHAALLEQLRVQLGPLGNWSAETGNAVLPRFVAPNPTKGSRQLLISEGTDGLIPPPVSQATGNSTTGTAKGTAAYVDPLDMLVNESLQALMLATLDNDLLPEDSRNTYINWFAIVAAVLRGFGVRTSDPAKLPKRQRTAYDALVAWSAKSAKHASDKDAVRKEMQKQHYLRNDHAMLTIGGVLAEKLLPEGAAKLAQIVSHEPELVRALDAARNDQVATQASAVKQAGEIVQQLSANAARTEARNARIKAEDRVMHNLPAALGPLRDHLVALASQGQIKSYADLMAHPEFEFFVPQIPVIIGILQIAGFGYAPHVSLEMNSEYHSLNTQMLALAPQGSGKTTTRDLVRGVLSHTPFARSFFINRIFSDSGFYQSTYARIGPAVMLGPDEAAKQRGFGDRDLGMKHMREHYLHSFDAKPGVPIPMNEYADPQLAQKRGIITPECPYEPVFHFATHEFINSISQDQLINGEMSRNFVYMRTAGGFGAKGSILARQIGGKVKKADAKKCEAVQKKAAEFILKQWEQGPRGQTDIFNTKNATDAEYRDAMYSRFDFGNDPANRIAVSIADKDESRFNDILALLDKRLRALSGDEQWDGAFTHIHIRAVEKLCRLGVLATLLVHPTARHIDMDILEWLGDLLYLMTATWAEHILNACERMVRSDRYTPSEVESIQHYLVGEKGVLNDGMAHRVSKIAINAHSKGLRSFLKDLQQKQDGFGSVKHYAMSLMHELNIELADDPQGGRALSIKLMPAERRLNTGPSEEQGKCDNYFAKWNRPQQQQSQQSQQQQLDEVMRLNARLPMGLELWMLSEDEVNVLAKGIAPPKGWDDLLNGLMPKLPPGTEPWMLGAP